MQGFSKQINCDYISEESVMVRLSLGSTHRYLQHIAQVSLMYSSRYVSAFVRLLFFAIYNTLLGVISKNQFPQFTCMLK